MTKTKKTIQFSFG